MTPAEHRGGEETFCDDCGAPCLPNDANSPEGRFVCGYCAINYVGEKTPPRWTIAKWDEDRVFVEGPVIEPEQEGLTGMAWVEAAKVEVVPASLAAQATTEAERLHKVNGGATTEIHKLRTERDALREALSGLVADVEVALDYNSALPRNRERDRHTLVSMRQRLNQALAKLPADA